MPVFIRLRMLYSQRSPMQIIDIYTINKFTMRFCHFTFFHYLCATLNLIIIYYAKKNIQHVTMRLFVGRCNECNDIVL